jgi:hypothetical protein
MEDGLWRGWGRRTGLAGAGRCRAFSCIGGGGAAGVALWVGEKDTDGMLVAVGVATFPPVGCDGARCADWIMLAWCLGWRQVDNWRFLRRDDESRMPGHGNGRASGIGVRTDVLRHEQGQ